jgi:hypothetical protein
MERTPYGHTRILLTDYPTSSSGWLMDEKAAKTAHTSVIANDMASRWIHVWRYMLTEDVE